MKKLIIFLLLTNTCFFTFAQGLNHQWLLGSYDFLQDPKGRMLINTNGYSLVNENRKMPFHGTQGNISDYQGNFLMSSNGVWIADATNDTMMNGSGLNPGDFVNSNPSGLVPPFANVFLPWPGDSNKYALFHHSATIGTEIKTFDLFLSVIDLTLNGGLGEVILKNQVILQDTLNWGIGACRHANGRDWWIVMMKDSSDKIFKILLTPNGVESISTQDLNYLPLPWGHVVQLTFSNVGNLMASTTYYPVIDSLNSTVLVFDFDRCTGIFSNTRMIKISDYYGLWGLAFSPSGEYVYTCGSYYLHQINIDSLIVDTIAIYDGFISPGPTCCPTAFFNIYLAANGKIYVTSGSTVGHLHEMNFPDSAGTACDFQQHAISLGYAHRRAVPNHPNYYLGAVTGSICDSIPSGIGINELTHDFRFSISPNPTNGDLKIIYLLPQNKSGKLEIYDITGKVIYEMRLPQWSTLQQFKLKHLSDGIYAIKISSDGYSVVKKLIITG